jgi:hypothetical protein
MDSFFDPSARIGLIATITVICLAATVLRLTILR